MGVLDIPTRHLAWYRYKLGASRCFRHGSGLCGPVRDYNRILITSGRARGAGENAGAGGGLVEGETKQCVIRQ
jgi:hypothetical protein